jgi:ferritin-like protein
MQATSTGFNRTGTTVSPIGTQAMTDAVNEYCPPSMIDTAAMEDERLIYINEADTVGSVPPPLSVKGVVKSGVSKFKGSSPSIFFDKMGERIAFERAGARLYEALIVKYQSVEEDLANLLPPVADLLELSAEDPDIDETTADLAAEKPAETLARIRSEELSHFKLLCDAMQQLGGDPTAITPCADVSATASSGIVQVLTDPRTTFAQCLNTMLTAELTDNAGWEILCSLAEDADEEELADRFLVAWAQEQQHLAIIKGWLIALMANGEGTAAV